MTRDTIADVCVVGLGASGLAAVEAALDRGLSVVGLDAGRIAAGASGRNGGFLLGGPAPRLDEALTRWGDCALGLYRATLAEIDRLEATLPPGTVRRAGSIRVAGWPGAPDPDEDAEIAAHAAALRIHGIAVEDYDGEFGRGVYLPDDAQTNPAVRAVATAARITAEHPSVALFEHSPVARVEAGTVVTEHGVVSAGAVVVAVDGGLDRLLPRLTGRVRTGRLQMLATDPAAVNVPCPVYGRRGYDYVQQGADGRLFVGGGRDRFVDAEWTHDTRPTDGVQAVIEQAATLVAGGPVRVTHRWAASVGFTGDGRALVTEVAPGVVAAGGYNGTGNLVGPVAARAALAYAVDGTPPPGYFAP